LDVAGKSNLFFGIGTSPGGAEKLEKTPKKWTRVEEYGQRQAVAKQGVKRVKKRIKNIPKPNVKFNISY
jgi:hypothetical protein